MTDRLDPADVKHVASLARLRIDDPEVALYAGQLARILDYVRQLNEVDTTGVPPTAHPLPITGVFRDDQPRPSWSQDDALANAPDAADSFFRVPRVLSAE